METIGGTITDATDVIMLNANFPANSEYWKKKLTLSTAII